MEFDYTQIKCPDFVKKEFPWANSVYVFTLKPDFHPYPEEFFVCQTGLGEDYHALLNAYMKEFAEKNIKGKYQIQCDKKSIDEKHLACCAGLGKMCKNNLFYSDKLEAFVNISEILCEEECDKEPVERKFHSMCENCDLCEKACPSKAIKDYTFNRPACVSFLTQDKENLSEEELKRMGNHLYGCDNCMNVCPLNHNKKHNEPFEYSLEYLAGMTNKEYEELRKKYPFAWIGKKIISRNAKNILKNKTENK